MAATCPGPRRVSVRRATSLRRVFPYAQRVHSCKPKDSSQAHLTPRGLKVSQPPLQALWPRSEPTQIYCEG